jgi:hypothetical protein
MLESVFANMNVKKVVIDMGFSADQIAFLVGMSQEC